MNHTKLTTLLTGLLLTGPATADPQTLWSVGKSDNNTAEFAHAPGDFNAYKAPGFFIVGQSDARIDWPYIQPGTVDGGWAPGTPQTFRVWFALDAVPSGDASLMLDLNDTHDIFPSKIRVAINDQTTEHQTPRGAGSFADPAKGRECLITIPVPADHLKTGVNQVSITTLNGAWIIWDCLRMEAPRGTRLGKMGDFSQSVIGSATSEDALFWQDGEKVQQVNVGVAHFGKPVKARLTVGNASSMVDLKQGPNQFTVSIPPVKEAGTLPVEIKTGGSVLAKEEITIKHVREWEVHLIHQTHLDIGYTHPQEEVLALQVEHIKNALNEIERTKDYPEDARFRFHPEGMWAIEEFFRKGTAEEKQRFLAAARTGNLHMDVLYAQAMTGLYTEEELMELMTSAKHFEKQFGIKVDSAMQSDVPGYTWGLATALAAHGVKYLSVGPNAGHRVGRLFDWADKPFYWESPSGKDRILFWMPEGGYSRFMGSIPGVYDVKNNMFMKRVEGVRQTLKRLEERGYPYDMVHIRYAIGSDNGPPDLTLSDVVKTWNETYASPRLIISSNSGMLKRFEKRYGKTLPVIKGDCTPYWEDGAASTSAATSINRRANDKLQQAQTLWSMVDPKLALHSQGDAAWQKMIMYDEHTWGAWNSISAPEIEFVLTQERYKKQFALDGSRITDAITAKILANRSAVGSSVIDVYNTVSWQRGDLVVLDETQSAAGDLVTDDAGSPVPSQRLASGELAFLARDIPAFGARRYTVAAGQADREGGVVANTGGLSNDLIKLTIDARSGAVSSLFHKALKKELVDSSKKSGINDYLQIIGRDANKGRLGISDPVTITVEDPGPLVATLRIESTAPGCQNLTRRIRIVSGSDQVELINTMDKTKERRPEGIYFGFPLNVPGGIAKIDVPWAIVQPEKDQMKGGNRNYYCVQRWVDVSNNDYGITWVTVDAPMLQFDPIKIAGASSINDWREHIEPGQHLHSWVMNNHWETNYKAYQEGAFSFHYVLKPHAGAYDAFQAQRAGRETCQPLVAVSAAPGSPVLEPMLDAVSEGIIVTSIRPSRDGEALMIRLFNTTDQARQANLKWKRKVGQTHISNPMEEKVGVAPNTIPMVKFEVITLRVERDNN